MSFTFSILNTAYDLDVGKYSEDTSLKSNSFDLRSRPTLNSASLWIGHQFERPDAPNAFKVKLQDEPPCNCSITSFFFVLHGSPICPLFLLQVLPSKFYLFTDKLQRTGHVSISEAYRGSGTRCKLTLLLDSRPALHTVFKPQSNFIKRLVMGRMSDIKSFLGFDTTIAFH